MRRAISILALFASVIGLPMAVAQTPDVASPLVSYQFLDSINEAPDQPNVVSTLVSYQFLDSLSDTPDQPNVVSPLISYQYFDWLGDENLTFEFSPVASYYFGGGLSLALTGIVKDLAGVPIAGAEVILQRHNTVFWQGMTNADGSLPAATLPAGNFNVVVIKAGYTNLFQSVPGDAGGPLFLDLTLRTGLVLPDLVTVNRTPEESAIRPTTPRVAPGTRPSHFKVFSGSSFSPVATLNPDRMTIVISHGWNPFNAPDMLADWATTLAFQIQSHHGLGTNAPNIIGWDWSTLARGIAPPIDEACDQGEYLGQTLLAELGPDYDQRIHFIGHSLGAIVNSYACDYAHASFSRGGNNPSVHWDKNVTRPHVTLLDEAELASLVSGQNVSTSASLAWEVYQRKSLLMVASKVAALDWKNAVPSSASWTDNYISLVGRPHKNAVNICLPSVAKNYNIRSGFSGLKEAHSYSHLWYRNSIVASGAFPQIGFRQSYEKAGDFPPNGTGKNLGNLWYEDTATQEPLDLILETDPSLYDQRAKILGSLALSSGGQLLSMAGQIVSAPGNLLLDSNATGLTLVGDLGGTAIVKTGQVVASTVDKVGNLWDAALDTASSINPERLFPGSISVSTFRFLLGTPSPTPGARGIRILPVAPQVWIPVQVPENAAFLAFDFTVTGEPAEDRIACAINEQNLFTLPARFAPDGSPVSTDLLDISAYAGQEVELYFGLVGGTSSGCTLAIDGIRFVTIPTPKLAATVVGDQVRLQWPAAATGWIPQQNPGLNPENWQDMALPETITAVDGVVTFERPRLAAKEFFRLRRVE